MKRSALFRIMAIAILATVLAGGSAHAGGIALYEFGSPDVGLAAAGYAARAQDASTVFTNPAGMSRLEKSQVLGGDMSVNQDRGPLAGRVAGDYSNTSFNFFALNLTWKY